MRTESAGGVVLNPAGRVLVVNQMGTSWSLPKGHLEEGEAAEAAARREILEEAGLADLKLVRPLGAYTRFKIGRDGGEDRSELKTITMFLFTTGASALKPGDPENPEARWVDPGRVGRLLTHPKDRAFFLRVLPSLRMRPS